MTRVIGVRHTGQPAASSATPLARDSQKRACPHGTNANPCRGSTRHTSQQSSGAAAAAAAEVGADDAADRTDSTVFSRFKLSMFHSSDLHPRPSMSSPAISAPP